MNQQIQRIKEMLKSHQWNQIVKIMACIVVFCTTYALILPAITLTHAAYCEMDEHTHTEECLENACSLEEHTHTLACYANPTADTDASVWLEALPEELTGVWEYDLTQIALSQVGYHESEANYIVLEDDWTQGYSIYGAAYGRPYDSWNNAFISWCMSKAEIPNELDEENEVWTFVPTDLSTQSWISKLEEEGLFVEPGADYEAKAGDIAFIDTINDGQYDGTGIIVEVIDDNTIQVVQGDLNDQVMVQTYHLDEVAIAYGIMPPNPEVVERLLAEINDLTIEDPEAALGLNTIEDNFDSIAFAMPMPRMFMAPLGLMPLSLEDEPLDITTGSHGGHNYIGLSGITVLWHESHDANVTGVLPWKPLPPSPAVIPADAHLRIEVQYAYVDPQELKDHGYQLKFVPDDKIKDLVASGKIKVGGENRGTITATEHEIVLSFDPVWVDQLIADNLLLPEVNKKSIYGDFYFQGELDLELIDQVNGHLLHLGPITLTLPVEDDAVAKKGTVEVEKAFEPKLIQDGSNYFVEYTLKVTAGEYGSPQVKVEDMLQHSSFIKAGAPYVGVTTTPTDNKLYGVANDRPVELFTNGSGTIGKTSYQATSDPTFTGAAGQGYKLIWNIGDMGPNEARTLTYRVAIDSSYIGTKHNSSEANAVINEAVAYSKTYLKDSDIKPYIPKVDAQIYKNRISTVDNMDGTFTLKYRVQITAPASNSYPLTNVKFTDDFGDRTFDAYGAGMVNNIQYVQSSVTLTDVYGTPIDYSSYHSTNPVWRSCTKPGVNTSNPNMFDLYIGDIDPGKTYYVEYDMIVDAQSAKLMTNGEIGLRNRGEIWDDETKHTPSQTLGYKDTNTTLDTYYWERKMGGSQIKSGITVDMTGGTAYYQGVDKAHYSATTPTLATIGSPPSSFTVPAGAFKYTVVVNERGDFDISNAEMLDEFPANAGGQIFLKYKGYVRVDVYDSLTSESLGNNEASVIAALAANTEVPQTYWVNVDNLQSFKYKASQLGLTGEKAYVLTYYAVNSADADAVSNTVTAANNFSVGGNIGPGGSLLLQPMKSTKSVGVVGGTTYNVEKRPWYYEEPDLVNEPTVFRHTTVGGTTPGTYPNYGSTYWAFELTGNRIPAGVQILEDTQNTGSKVDPGGASGYEQSVTPDSFVGVYIGDLGDTNGEPNTIEYLENLGELETLVADGSFTKLVKGVDYNTVWHDGNTKRLTRLTFLKDVVIPSGHKIYVVVRAYLAKAVIPNKLAYFINYYQYSTTPGPLNSGSKNVSFNYADTGIGITKTAGDIFKVSNNHTKYEKYNSSTKQYVTTTTTKNTDGLLTSLVYDWDGSAWTEQSWLKGWTTASYGTSGNGYTYDDGVYASWYIEANPGKNLLGAYEIIDTLPKGVELCYVKTWHINGSYSLTGTNPSIFKSYYIGPGYTNPSQSGMPEGGWNLNTMSPTPSKGWAYTVTGQRLDWVAEGYREHMVAAPFQSNNPGSFGAGGNDNRFATIFYTRDNPDTGDSEVRLYLPYVQKQQPLKFEILVKLTDPNIYFGDTEFYNEAEIANRYGHFLGKSGDTITYRTSAVSKSDLNALIASGAVSSSDYMSGGALTTPILPYQIEINPDAVDMETDSDIVSVPLVDFMSDNLSMNMDTLRVYKNSINDANLLYSGETVQKKNSLDQLLYYDSDDHEVTTDTGNPVMITRGNTGSTTIRVSQDVAIREGVNGKAIKFHELPDETKLIITYKVSALLKSDGTANGYSNAAYWEGHDNMENGETKTDSMVYQAGASAGTLARGGLQIVKHDGADESIRLQGAKFALYRAQYEDYPGTALPTVYESGSSTPLTIDQYVARLTINQTPTSGHTLQFKKNGSYYAFYWIEDANPDNEIVGYSNESHPGYTLTSSLAVWDATTNSFIPYNDYHSQIVISFNPDGLKTYHHELLTDADGNALREENPINANTVRSTNASGILKYGLEAGEDAIHFNKVYCVKEIKAPTGYELEDKEYFFVVPTNNSTVINGNYNNFFNRDSWPKNVYTVKRELGGVPTYFLDVFNYKGKASVTKDFGGNAHAGKPGNYTFAIYATVLPNGEPDLTSRVGDPEVLTYTNDDFNISIDPITNKTIYTLKPGVTDSKFVTFEGLSFNTNYYVYELNDAGIPIVGNRTGTVNDETYFVTYKDKNTDVATNVVRPYMDTGGPVIPIVIATNSTFAASITKQFRDVDGSTVLPQGIVGTYAFGIWRESKVVAGVPQGAPMDTVYIVWESIDDMAATKTHYFTGLEPGQNYYIFELKTPEKGAIDGDTVEVNGNTYVVHYDSPQLITIDASDPNVPNVRISNTATVSLPLSGGTGTTMFTISGVFLMFAALWYKIHLKKRDERGEYP